MKRVGILAGVIVMAFLMAAMLYIGCSREADTGVVAPTGGTPAADAYTVTGCDGSQVTVLAPQFAEYTQSAQGEYDQVLQLGEVQYVIAKFDSLGYALDLPNSFIMAGSGITPDSTDTVAVRLVNVILRCLADSSSSFIRIAYISSPDHTDLPGFITTSIWSFVPPVVDPGSYSEVYAGKDEHGRPYSIWVKDCQTPFDSKGVNSSIAAWGWGRWAACTAAGSVSICAGAAAGCTLAGPGYGHCLAAGCVGGAVASAIGCAFAQWF